MRPTEEQRELCNLLDAMEDAGFNQRERNSERMRAIAKWLLAAHNAGAQDIDAASADRIARTLRREPSEKVKAIYEKLANAYTVPVDGEVAKQYYLLGFIDGECSITNAPELATQPMTLNAGAQEPVAYTSADRLKLIAERNRHVDTMWPASMRDAGDIPLYIHPQPMTNAARDVQDAKRYRFLKSQMRVGAVQTQLPLYRTLHWIGFEDCDDVRNADDAIDAEIERLDRAKGE